MTTREVIQGELGLEKVSSRRSLLRIRFWSKIIKMKKNRLVYKVYKKRREEFIKGEKKDKKKLVLLDFYNFKRIKPRAYLGE